MTPTQEDAELADFILGRSARLVDLDRITAFRLAAEERGARMEREQIVAWLREHSGSFKASTVANAIEACEHRQIDPASLGAE
jgi:hypothetical protein